MSHLRFAKNRLFLVLAACAISVCKPVHAAEPSHCTPDETAYFNCTFKTSGKTASLCGSADPKNRYLQYRFGRINGAMELEVPSSKQDQTMSKTFYFEYGVTKDRSRSDAIVWFKHADTYYELDYGEDWNKADRVIGSDSTISIWIGEAAGSPKVMNCERNKSGANLGTAGDLVARIAAPDHHWTLSPWDCGSWAIHLCGVSSQ